MRDLIYCLNTWVRPGLRRLLHALQERARGCLALPHAPVPAPVLPTAPAYDRGPLPDHVQQRYKPLDAEEVGLVRPYYVTFEQNRRAEQVRRTQKERRTAAALATPGVDYDPGLALSVGA